MLIRRHRSWITKALIFTNRAINKAAAIQFVLERERLTAADATAIGDGPNDLEMVEAYDGYAIAGTSLAAEQPELKTVASVAELLADS